jgi:hypothetical protein
VPLLVRAVALRAQRAFDKCRVAQLAAALGEPPGIFDVLVGDRLFQLGDALVEAADLIGHDPQLDPDQRVELHGQSFFPKLLLVSLLARRLRLLHHYWSISVLRSSI